MAIAKISLANTSNIQSKREAEPFQYYDSQNPWFIARRAELREQRKNLFQAGRAASPEYKQVRAEMRAQALEAYKQNSSRIYNEAILPVLKSFGGLSTVVLKPMIESKVQELGLGQCYGEVQKAIIEEAAKRWDELKLERDKLLRTALKEFDANANLPRDIGAWQALLNKNHKFRRFFVANYLSINGALSSRKKKVTCSLRKVKVDLLRMQPAINVEVADANAWDMNFDGSAGFYCSPKVSKDKGLNPLAAYVLYTNANLSADLRDSSARIRNHEFEHFLYYQVYQPVLEKVSNSSVNNLGFQGDSPAWASVQTEFLAYLQDHRLNANDFSQKDFNIFRASRARERSSALKLYNQVFIRLRLGEAHDALSHAIRFSEGFDQALARLEMVMPIDKYLTGVYDRIGTIAWMLSDNSRADEQVLRSLFSSLTKLEQEDLFHRISIHKNGMIKLFEKLRPRDTLYLSTESRAEPYAWYLAHLNHALKWLGDGSSQSAKVKEMIAARREELKMIEKLNHSISVNPVSRAGLIERSFGKEKVAWAHMKPKDLANFKSCLSAEHSLLV